LLGIESKSSCARAGDIITEGRDEDDLAPPCVVGLSRTVARGFDEHPRRVSRFINNAQ